jgi:hypothetical protein
MINPRGVSSLKPWSLDIAAPKTLMKSATEMDKICVLRLTFGGIEEGVVFLVSIVSRTIVTSRLSIFGEECVNVVEW